MQSHASNKQWPRNNIFHCIMVEWEHIKERWGQSKLKAQEGEPSACSSLSTIWASGDCDRSYALCSLSHPAVTSLWLPLLPVVFLSRCHIILVFPKVT